VLVCESVHLSETRGVLFALLEILSVLQCVAVCCSMLQCVAVCCTTTSP